MYTIPPNYFVGISICPDNITGIATHEQQYKIKSTDYFILRFFVCLIYHPDLMNLIETLDEGESEPGGDFGELCL
ncbi:hypothetical protein BSK56_12150 [Paenibacillus borealis]|uniref:Uncharacterized protein n=2 Tax=Paenibacillus TaxID=44249 RepID=A0ABX3HDJ3_PAEBO|nr:hypothetical protein BSK56_12150 [Paenibacillus borealis]